MERTIEILFICPATWGNNSEICIPGTLVEIGRKLLFDLGSQVSM
jgi:hypothetical protein